MWGKSLLGHAMDCGFFFSPLPFQALSTASSTWEAVKTHSGFVERYFVPMGLLEPDQVPPTIEAGMGLSWGKGRM